MKIYNSKRGVVGKADDLLLLIVLCIFGFFLIIMFFINSAEAGDLELECIAYNWRVSEDFHTLLYSPVTLDGGVTVKFYTLLTGEGNFNNYSDKIKERMDFVY